MSCDLCTYAQLILRITCEMVSRLSFDLALMRCEAPTRPGGDQPKFLTKAELREAAIRELKVSKNSFDFGWISAIEVTGRYDWREPLKHRFRSKS